VLPIGGWLASVLGRKRFFMACLTIFTVSSLLCGLAPSIIPLVQSASQSTLSAL
jgi:DHA2 family multidrug resistance protein